MTKQNTMTAEEKRNAEMVEEIATNIAKLSRQTTALLNGRLKRQTIVILLAQMTKMPQRDIYIVLDALEQMENITLK